MRSRDAATGGGAGGDSDAAAAPDAADKPKSTVLVNIDKSTQEMTVFVDGMREIYLAGVDRHERLFHPVGNLHAGSMNEIWYSKQWDNAPMPHAIFFTKQGHAIHGSLDVKTSRLGRLAWLRPSVSGQCRPPCTRW